MGTQTEPEPQAPSPAETLGTPPTAPEADLSDILGGPPPPVADDDPLFVEITPEAEQAAEAEDKRRAADAQAPTTEEAVEGDAEPESDEQSGEAEGEAEEQPESEAYTPPAPEGLLDGPAGDLIRQRIAEDPEFAAEFARALAGAPKGPKGPKAQQTAPTPKYEPEKVRAKVREILADENDPDREIKAVEFMAESLLEVKLAPMREKEAKEKADQEWADKRKKDWESFTEKHPDWNQYQEGIAHYFKSRRTMIGEAAMNLPFEDALRDAKAKKGPAGVPPAAKKAAAAAAATRKAQGTPVTSAPAASGPGTTGPSKKSSDQQLVERQVQYQRQTQFRLP